MEYEIITTESSDDLVVITIKYNDCILKIVFPEKIYNDEAKRKEYIEARLKACTKGAS